MNYEDAMKELQSITQDLEKGEVKMNELTEKLQRAKELLQFCKNKLRGVEGEIQKLNENT